MSIDYLKEMMDDGNSVKAISIPAIHPDSLDSQDNIVKYSEAKPVLEHPEVNAVLKEMGALDLLNKYDVDSYHNMAVWVIEALEVFVKENADTPQAVDFDFSIKPLNEELNDFSVEFLIEFTTRRFEDTVPDGAPAMAPPPQADSWIDKLASKFGLSDFGIKDFLYLYLLNKFGKRGALDDQKSIVPVKEEYIMMLAEKAPPGMEGWIKSVKSKFQKEYGDDWEEVLYATAWKRHKEGLNEGAEAEISSKEMRDRLPPLGWEENGGVALWSHPDHPDFWIDNNTGSIWVYPTQPLTGPFSGSFDSFLEIFNNLDEFLAWVDSGEADARAAKYKKMATEAGWRGYVEDDDDMGNMYEGVDDIHGGADKAENVPEPHAEAAPKPSAKVKKDVKQRIKELDKLIADYKEKPHFFGEVKPAIFNAKEALELIQDKLNAGTVGDFKEAQIHFQKLMSPITNLFPPSLVKFLAHGTDGEENKMKDV